VTSTLKRKVVFLSHPLDILMTFQVWLRALGFAGWPAGCAQGGRVLLFFFHAQAYPAKGGCVSFTPLPTSSKGPLFFRWIFLIATTIVPRSRGRGGGRVLTPRHTFFLDFPGGASQQLVTFGFRVIYHPFFFLWPRNPFSPESCIPPFFDGIFFRILSEVFPNLPLVSFSQLGPFEVPTFIWFSHPAEVFICVKCDCFFFFVPVPGFCSNFTFPLVSSFEGFFFFLSRWCRNSLPRGLCFHPFGLRYCPLIPPFMTVSFFLDRAPSPYLPRGFKVCFWGVFFFFV